jgi:precorrin-2/cobalt-factor-2 C20-methyltransferase
MRRSPDERGAGYDRIARRLVEESHAGRVAGYLTEGDPMLFGSGSYVAETIQALDPAVPVEIIPGVSAISAAAARLGWPLARKGDVLTLCPAMYHADEIGEILDRGGPVCWLKAADVLPKLVDELRARDRLKSAALVERVGCPDERVFRDLAAAVEEHLSYFSIVLVR